MLKTFVINAGGEYFTSPLSSAEVYDSATGTWASTGPMATPRQSHTATLLPNGQVLVAGGGNASAEVYDLATGTWASTGALATPRIQHTATLLPNGQVLVAGGFGSGPLSSAEMYDLATGTWTATGPLITARVSHTATLLPNGKVLAAGGGIINGTLSSAELYCPPSTDLGCNPTNIPDCDLTIGATDNCSVPTVSCVKVDTTNGCARTRTLTYTAVDACGNSNTCTQAFTWKVDTTPPAFTNCPPTLDWGAGFGLQPGEHSRLQFLCGADG